MHELSIATAVVESADAAARRHGAASVESVRLRVGELAGVVADALRFSFGLAAEGTALAGARLEIEEVPARARCGGCPGDFAVGSPPSLECPGCGRSAAELLTGRELEIAAVTLPEPDAPAGVPPPSLS
ncbi:hydrogenase maturation nickel metallochaperone HypA [Streptomyces chumphonensis]|uniref:Hydrogenase maturation factor HypA n=1 Tax=Streptomyces chumphonensis TaxID=1214925 RepID=A0A927F2F9_9ACTN|nr:hydrogenase maturation nickel metallochaperone HypA [Streptomyces chumphonensis]MBD3933492.1 hydrogenase maturation nickel metallochaperone HypA [Streptomyces chumphonensis]